MSEVCHVAIGLVVNETNEILVAQRPLNVAGGGLWEFPGGKVEPGETPEQALKRELFEEVGIVVDEAEQLIKLEYQYPNRKILLDAWLVNEFEGTAEGMEGQIIQWIPIDELMSLDMLLANAAIVDAFFKKMVH